MGWTFSHQRVRAQVFERNTLASVIAQLRFQPILKIEQDIAAFQEKVRPIFPKYNSTEIQEIEVGPGGVSTRATVAHRFMASNELSGITLSSLSLSIEYTVYESREALLRNYDIALAALGACYQPIAPVRLGLRYVNIIHRDRISEDLHRQLDWTDILSGNFASIPGGLATTDAATNFHVEITAPSSPGVMTVRYGLLPNRLLGETSDGQQHFRIDTDRYVSSDFGLDDVRALLVRFSEDTFQVFMTSVGPALREWMGSSKERGE